MQVDEDLDLAARMDGEDLSCIVRRSRKVEAARGAGLVQAVSRWVLHLHVDATGGVCLCRDGEADIPARSIVP